MAEMTIAPKRSPNEDLESIGLLWEGFLENYDAFKAKKMHLKDEDKYRLLSVPGPTQYRAFVQLFDFFKKEEQLVKEYPDILYTYDLIDEELETLPILEVLQNLCSSVEYDVKGKNIVMASGSFWGQNPAIRAKIISCLEDLYKKGAVVTIFARAGKDEESVTNIIEPIKEKSRFGLRDRIPIHFLRVDKDYIQLELPHTESVLFRLNMFLDLNKIEPELKEGRTKEDLLAFFNNLITKAL
jgi:hypothetical protein